LRPIVGADRIRATVNVEYETGSSEESQEKYDPAVSAPLNMQHSEEGTGPARVTAECLEPQAMCQRQASSRTQPVTKEIRASIQRPITTRMA
jgi:flagellar biosynthesis/type III secretory pathway M-ring protein FliF/YscJ